MFYDQVQLNSLHSTLSINLPLLDIKKELCAKEKETTLQRRIIDLL